MSNLEVLIDTTADLENSGLAAVGIGLEQKIRGQPVRVDPGCPVVQVTCFSSLNSLNIQQEVVAFEGRIENAAFDFEPDAARDHRVQVIELGTEQVVYPGQDCARGGGKEIDDRLLDVG